MIDFEALRQNYPVLLSYHSAVADVLIQDTSKKVEATSLKAMADFANVYRRGVQFAFTFGGFPGYMAFMRAAQNMVNEPDSLLAITLKQIKAGIAVKVDGRALFSTLTKGVFKPATKNELLAFLREQVKASMGTYQPAFAEKVLCNLDEVEKAKPFEVAAHSANFGGETSYVDLFYSVLLSTAKGWLYSYEELGALGICNLFLRYMLSAEYRRACLALSQRLIPEKADTFESFVQAHFKGLKV